MKSLVMKWAQHRILSVVFAALAAGPACTRVDQSVPAVRDAGLADPGGFAAVTARESADLRALEALSLDELQVAITRTVTGWSEDNEGGSAPRVRRESAGTAAFVLVEVEPLADDSIRAQQYRIHVAPVGGYWRVTAAQVRWKCWPERGESESWTTTLCL